MSIYYRNCIGQAKFCHKFNLRVNIWEQNTETEKTNVFLWYVQSEQSIFIQNETPNKKHLSKWCRKDRRYMLDVKSFAQVFAVMKKLPPFAWVFI